MPIPSVTTLAHITSYPRELRRLLEVQTAEGLIRLLDAEGKPFGPRSEFEGFRKCSHQYGYIGGQSFFQLKMAMADELCETYGLEHMPKGYNMRSPAFHYLNAGDTYTTTLLYCQGRYRVACWGDIVERGSYA